MSQEKKKADDGSVPEVVLHQLGEHALGGFALFYFNSQTGLPENVVNFDSPAHSLAMQKYISDWSIALQELNIDASKLSIQATHRRPDDDDSEEEAGATDE